jgi:type II secretory pathway component PulC
MKTSLKSLVVVISGTVLLLLAGFMGLQEMKRQNLVNSTRFTEQYAGVVRQLSENIHSVQKKMDRNDTGTVAAVDIRLETAADPSPGENERKITLQGISWNTEKPLVIIENRTYKIGDTVGGCTIQEIFPQTIILKNADGVQKEITLTREKQP